jgi:D-glycero-alpha-D-manno-heptose-7-phosphate kinase
MNDGVFYHVEAPCRADLAGGTLDIWPLGLLHLDALTVNTAIPVMVRLEVDLEGPAGEVLHSSGGDWQRLGPSDAATDLTAAVAYSLWPDGGVRVRVFGQAPLGSGLGGSSTYAMALGRALLTACDLKIEDPQLVGTMRDLEARVLRVPTGAQDHWPAIRGGVLALHHQPGGPYVERLDIDPDWIGDRMTVFFTGLTRHSGMVNWQVIRRRLDGDHATTEALESIADAARDCRSAILGGDEAGVSASIAAEWTARKGLAPEVCPPELAKVEQAAVDAGALAFKACGAGGGGSVLVWHGPGARSGLATALGAVAPGGCVLASSVATTGCQVRAGVTRGFSASDRP